MSVGDVTVFGLVVGTHIIEDLGLNVPHGQTITIPAEQALRSKDLWRAIGQKCLFQIQSGPYVRTNGPVIPIPPTPPVHSQVAVDKVMLDRQRALEEENRQLREQLARQQAEFQEAEKRQQAKLDAILDLLRAGVPVSGVTVPAQGRQINTVVADDAPTFIPAVIRPEHAQTRIEAKKSEVESNVSGAADKLRELRRKAKP